MILTYIIYLPMMFGLFWMLIHTLLASKTVTFSSILLVFAAWTVYAFSDCVYNDFMIGTPLLTAASNASQLSGPCIIPAVLMYMQKLRTKKPVKAQQALIIVFPVTLFTVALLLTYLAGPAELETFIERLYSEGNSVLKDYPHRSLIRLYFIFAVIAYRVVLLSEILLLLSRILRDNQEYHFSIRKLTRFLFGKGKITVVELQYFNLILIFSLAIAKIFLFRDMLEAHRWISPSLAVILTLFISAFAFVALFSAKKEVSRHELFHGWQYNYSPDTQQQHIENSVNNFLMENGEQGVQVLRDFLGEIKVEAKASQEEDDDELTLAERIFSDKNRTWAPNSLMGRFERMMMEDKAFLHSGLTLLDVAENLGTNKTYASRMINNTYKMSFPDLINTLRIDYAEEYIVTHRNAKQTDIATACGFTSAAALNSAFRKVTGLTPRIWLASYDQRHKH